MPTVDLTIKFNSHINDSVQVGDIMFYGPAAVSNNTNTVNSYGNIKKMGKITSVRRSRPGGYITVDHDQAVLAPTATDFLFFSKDNMANLTSLLGYYIELKFVNTSTSKAELYQIGVETTESSK
tara:strand:+ start:1408 stop:1779 length:372 start_codon:yes stop_codon:yes gene_type:complete